MGLIWKSISSPQLSAELCSIGSPSLSRYVVRYSMHSNVSSIQICHCILYCNRHCIRHCNQQCILHCIWHCNLHCIWHYNLHYIPHCNLYCIWHCNLHCTWHCNLCRMVLDLVSWIVVGIVLSTARQPVHISAFQYSITSLVDCHSKEVYYIQWNCT